jgi:hypothetical protein
MKAMDGLRIDLWDVASILESGCDCFQGKRKATVRERCCRWRGLLLKVIVSREATGWVDGADAWIVVNVIPC